MHLAAVADETDMAVVDVLLGELAQSGNRNPAAVDQLLHAAVAGRLQHGVDHFAGRHLQFNGVAAAAVVQAAGNFIPQHVFADDIAAVGTDVVFIPDNLGVIRLVAGVGNNGLDLVGPGVLAVCDGCGGAVVRGGGRRCARTRAIAWRGVMRAFRVGVGRAGVAVGNDLHMKDDVLDLAVFIANGAFLGRLSGDDRACAVHGQSVGRVAQLKREAVRESARASLHDAHKAAIHICLRKACTIAQRYPAIALAITVVVITGIAAHKELNLSG